VTRRTADAEGVEQLRSSLHRLAPVALTALGIFGAVLMIFAGLLALNHSVLPFDGWPLNDERQATGSQVLPRAPAETGRLRTADGGARAEINDGTVVIGSTIGAGAPVVVGSAARIAPVVHLRPQRSSSRSHVPKARARPSAPAVAVTPAAVVPAATPAPVPQPAPAPAAPVVVRDRHVPPGQAKKMALGQAKKAVPAPAPAVVAAVPPAPAVPAVTAAPAVPAGPGNGHGKGHAYGHYKH
jgi:hypothetical protein